MFFFIRYLLFAVLTLGFLQGAYNAEGQPKICHVALYTAFFAAAGAIFLF